MRVAMNWHAGSKKRRADFIGQWGSRGFVFVFDVAFGHVGSGKERCRKRFGIRKDRQIDQIRQIRGFALQNGLPTNLSLGNRRNRKLLPTIYENLILANFRLHKHRYSDLRPIPIDA